MNKRAKILLIIKSSGSLTILPKAMKNRMFITRFFTGSNNGIKYIELKHRTKAVIIKIMMAFKSRQSKKFVTPYRLQISSTKESSVRI